MKTTVNETILSKYEKPPYTSLTPEQVAILKLRDDFELLRNWVIEEIRRLERAAYPNALEHEQ